MKQISNLSSNLTNFRDIAPAPPHASATFAGRNTLRLTVESTQVACQASPKLKKLSTKQLIQKKKSSRIRRSKETQVITKLENILFGQFGITINLYGHSRCKLMEVTLDLIEQIRDKAKTLKLFYDKNDFREKHKKFTQSISEDDLSPYQKTRRKKNQILNELKKILGVNIIGVNKLDENLYCKVLSSACDYLNDYLNQRNDSTADYDDDVMHFSASTHPVESQSLSQSSLALVSFPIEEELTVAEKLALIRLKNVLNRYPIPQIDIENFGELVFAAAYCIKMNSDMMPVSELYYNQHYLKHFHTPDPYNNPRDEIEDYLGGLENTEFGSCMDPFEPEALLTTDSLNLTAENLEDEASSARAKKITATLDLAAQYLENEKYIELQNILAYENLIDDDEPKYKKMKV